MNSAPIDRRFKARRFWYQDMLSDDVPLTRVVLLGLCALLLSFIVAAHSLAHVGISFRALNWAGPLLQSPGTPLRASVRDLATANRLRQPARSLAAAQHAIALAPLHAPALGVAGFALEQTRGRRAAQLAFTHASRLSRREGTAQYWLINNAIRRGDAATALRHYDVLLRTLPTGAAPLVQQMALVTQLPQGRSALRPYVRADNPWLADYLDAALRLPRAAPLGEMLAGSAQLPDRPVLRPYMAGLVAKLAAENEVALLARLYPRLPGAQAGALSSANIVAPPAGGDYPPVTWRLSDEGEGSAALVAAEGDNGLGFDVFALPSVRRTLASKLILVQPGSYRLSWRVSDQEVNPFSDMVWQARCVGGVTANSEAATLATSGNVLAERGAPQQMLIAVPASCPGIMLSLVMAGGDGVSPSRAIIDAVRLVRQ